MTDVTISLDKRTLRNVKQLISDKKESTIEDVTLQALQNYIEEHEVEEILAASKEPHLEGDLDELASKMAT